MSVLAEVKRLVAETCAVDPAGVRDDTRLAALGLDSVRAIDLLVDLEQRYGVALPEREAARLVTVGDLAAWIERKRAG